MTFYNASDAVYHRSIYMTCVHPTLEYASGAWGGLGVHEAKRLECRQCSAARVIIGVSLSEKIPHAILLAQAVIQPLSL